MNKKIILAVTGSISAYKSIEILRLLIKESHQVVVVLSKGALAFIQPLPFQALGAKDVRCELMDPTSEATMSHIKLARWADILLIAPASANILARLANGFADDLLSTLYLATHADTVIAPAMNSNMLQHQSVQENLQKLLRKNVHIINSETGELACGEVGQGRLANIETIIQRINKLIIAPLFLNKHILITAGPTQEAIDPVRYISNHSSGKMGFALAKVAKLMGAKVTLICGPVSLPDIPNIKMVKIVSAEDMFEAVKKNLNGIDVFISCAAVADYKVKTIADQKIKKSEQQMILKLSRNPDIVSYVSKVKQPPVVIGFAAETENLKENAKKKLQKKSLDMIVANLVGLPNQGFDTNINAVSIIDSETSIDIEKKEKDLLAYDILKAVSKKLK